MHLVCSRRCGSNLFRALFAEVDINAAGDYQDHRIAQPGYVCLSCGAPALDLAVVSADMEAVAQEDEASSADATADILCPVCETLVQVGGEMECPNCGAPLQVA